MPLLLLLPKTCVALRTLSVLAIIAIPTLVHAQAQAQAQAQRATYSDGLLQLPTVWAEGAIYRVDLQLKGNSRPFLFELVKADLGDTVTDTDAIFEEDVLTIVSVDVGGIPHWARLRLVSMEPAVFELLTGGIDDDDDDNDGLPDAFDENPLTPELCTHPLCMTEPSSTGLPVRDSLYRGYTEDPHAPMVNP
ncbi:MAG: hypothetical protein WD396_00680 [Pseudohongiellaceae bacterium]